ncbi:MAG TPA: DUF1501 domain-containing protein, partial [Prolixibacteraceae bacterium]|nr:DUF1501 domain-containing protein [Prolixibacteraceae bacterium]
ARAALPAADLLKSLDLGRKLVLIQLDGGNDGLNMVIPISQYDNLANARRNILVDRSQILKLTEETGLHPAMPELTNLYKEGKVKIIQGVGYPNPNLSHFRSKDILISASDAKTVINSGWIGRMFGKQYPEFPAGFPNDKQPHPISLTIGSTSSATCQGEMANFSTVLKSLSSAYINNSPATVFPETPFGNELKFITNVMEQTESYLAVIKAAAASAKNLSSLYPAAGTNSLADQLKMVANLIAGGLQTQVYVVSLGGWDTHSGQVSSETNKLTGTHPVLLGKLSRAIAAFQDDIKLMNKDGEVMGFVYTEFGRRIKSNDSLGTDHGTTWPAIVFGSNVNPGILGDNPVIPAVVGKSDNLAMQFDFRSIYAGFYKQWFNLADQDTAQILGASFPEIQLIGNTTGIDPAPELPTGTLKLYPNPVSDTATLSFLSEGNWLQIRIYSMSGTQVKILERQQFPSGQQQLQLQLGNLPGGTYVLILQQKNNFSEIKFIVRK